MPVHRLLLLILLFAPALVSFAGTPAAESGDDVYAAGPTVHVLGDVNGDAVVAGGIVTLVNSVGQDIMAAGGSITVTANVGDDIRAAGGSITVTGNVGGDAVLAGGNVILGPGNTVAGRAWLAGGNVTVAASVGGNVKVAAGHILLSGRFDGDVDLLAQSIAIQDSAIINGKLTYTSPKEADIQEGARIQGPVTRRSLDSQRDATSWTGSFFDTLTLYLSLAVSALVMYWLVPGVSRAATHNIETQSLKSLGFGILVVVAAPVVALMLLASVLGIPLAFALLAGYLVMLLAGYLTGLMFVGEFLYRGLGKQPEQTLWTRTVAILLGAGVLFVLSFVPVLGALACLVVIVFGTGALKLTFYEYYRQSDRSRERSPDTSGA